MVARTHFTAAEARAVAALKQSPDFIAFMGYLGRTLEDATLTFIGAGEHLESHQGRVRALKTVVDEIVTAEQTLAKGKE